MRIRALRLVLGPAACTLACAGCLWFVAGAAAGAGAVVWAKGSLARIYEAPYETVSRAARGAVRDLEYTVTSVRHDASVTVIHAKRADNAPVKIQVSRVDASRARVSVRVGRVGRREPALVVLDAITRRVGR